MFAKVKLPELFAVTFAIVVPPWASATVAPLPLAAGVIVPEILQVTAVAVAVKGEGNATLVPLTVTCWLSGLNVNPALLGVTV